MALVLPFAILLLFGVIQFGALFFLQNTMAQVASDVVRRIAVGELSDADARTLAAERLASWNATFTILVDEPAAGDVRLSVSVPIDDAAIIDFGDFLGDGTLSAQATMRKET